MPVSQLDGLSKVGVVCCLRRSDPVQVSVFNVKSSPYEVATVLLARYKRPDEVKECRNLFGTQ